IDKLRSGGGARDGESLAVVAELWDRWLTSFPEEQRTPAMQSHDEFRWMVEELRISMFAQPLGTSVKVSPTRCEKLLSADKR
ncbi:MAG: DUF3418 domain-containing protein, partial [Planctomycetota bacterium]